MPFSNSTMKKTIAVGFREHILLTYYQTRLAMTLACWGLPIVLLLGGTVLLGVDIQPTLSNYYYAEQPPAYARTVFVGLLVLLGGLCLSYRGYDNVDNNLHNVAGIAAFGVAVFPMECPFPMGQPEYQNCVATSLPGFHYASALVLFIVAIASIFYAGGKRFRATVQRVHLAYSKATKLRIASAAIIGVGVAITGVLLLCFGPSVAGRYIVVPESMAFFGFGLHWATLNWLIAKANDDAMSRARVAATVQRDATTGNDEVELIP